jgi:predicted transcriptional regulator
MNDSGDSHDLYECSACGNVGIGDGTIRCCDGPMDVVDPVSVIEEPTLEDLLYAVFDMSATELDICLCVMEDGDLTVSELAERIGYDRSVVSRHLAHLAELGIIERQRRLLEQGGHTYVYSPVPAETVRAQLRSAFFAWVRTATARLDSLQREKVEAIADSDDATSWRIFRET